MFIVLSRCSKLIGMLTVTSAFFIEQPTPVVSVLISSSQAMSRPARSAIYKNLAAGLVGEVILFIKDLHELISGNNSDGREGIKFDNIEMPIICYKEICIARYRQVTKLVIIFIVFD